MRKVLLKVFFIICFALSVIGTMPVSSTANEMSNVEVVSGEEYIYVKMYIGDVLYVFVFALDGAIVDCYPDSCSGGPYGGPL